MAKQRCSPAAASAVAAGSADASVELLRFSFGGGPPIIIAGLKARFACSAAMPDPAALGLAPPDLHDHIMEANKRRCASQALSSVPRQRGAGGGKNRRHARSPLDCCRRRRLLYRWPSCGRCRGSWRRRGRWCRSWCRRGRRRGSWHGLLGRQQRVVIIVTEQRRRRLCLCCQCACDTGSTAGTGRRVEIGEDRRGAGGLCRLEERPDRVVDRVVAEHGCHHRLLACGYGRRGRCRFAWWGVVIVVVVEHAWLLDRLLRTPDEAPVSVTRGRGERSTPCPQIHHGCAHSRNRAQARRTDGAMNVSSSSKSDAAALAAEPFAAAVVGAGTGGGAAGNAGGALAGAGAAACGTSLGAMATSSAGSSKRLFLHTRPVERSGDDEMR